MGWVEVMSLLQKRWFYKVLGEAEGNVAMTETSGNQRKPARPNGWQGQNRSQALPKDI
jgi:hypothetical protein